MWDVRKHHHNDSELQTRFAWGGILSAPHGLEGCNVMSKTILNAFWCLNQFMWEHLTVSCLCENNVLLHECRQQQKAKHNLRYRYVWIFSYTPNTLHVTFVMLMWLFRHKIKTCSQTAAFFKDKNVDSYRIPVGAALYLHVCIYSKNPSSASKTLWFQLKSSWIQHIQYKAHWRVPVIRNSWA